jgi:DNA adenine methylase
VEEKTAVALWEGDVSFLGDIASALGSLLGVKGDACPTSLQPLVQWPGGKARLAKKINGLFPEHDTYVEPFAGGASVFFHKPLAKKNVISDVDPWLIGLYKDVRAGKLENNCDLGIRASKSLFERSKKNQSPCHKIALSTLSYHGDRKGYYINKNKHIPKSRQEGSVVLARKLGQHKCYEAKLKRAIVAKKDFAAVMREHDSKTTVHFLDPPWPLDYSDKYAGDTKAKVGKSRNKREFGGAMDPEHVRRVCDKMKGTVVVIYNWTPELQRTFSGPGWKTQKWSVSTGGNRGTGSVMKPNLVAIKRAK